MATKTITLDLEAYDRLKAMKQPSESFSDVVKRLTNERPRTVAHFLEALEELNPETDLPSPKTLDLLEEYLEERPPYVPPRDLLSD